MPCQLWGKSLAALAVSVGTSVVADKSDAWAAFSQHGWSSHDEPISHGAAVPLPPLTVLLALKMQNVDVLESEATRVSNPQDMSYGHFLKRNQVNRIIEPLEEDIIVVREFLGKAPGTSKWSKGRDMVQFTCDVPCIEEVFGTTIRFHTNPTKPGNSPIRSATPVKLPDRVAAALDGVSLNAPVFMPMKPKQAPEAPYAFPASGRHSPRISPKLIAGDRFLSLRFVAYCKHGKPNTNSLEEGICDKDGGLKDNIASFEIVVLQGPRSQKVVTVPATLDVLGQREASCGDGGACVEFNLTVGNIGNFLSTTARIRAQFADGTVTPFSDPAELPPVWPLPYMTPTVLADLYGIPIARPVHDARNIISVAEFAGQFFNPEDLETFFHMMGVRSWRGEGKSQPKLIGKDMPGAGSVLGGEAQLDLQYIMALAANVTTWFWSVPGTEVFTTQEPFLHWLMQLADSDDDNMPLVHSVSYTDDEAFMPRWFTQRVSLELAKLALRGVSVLAATGDDGAAGLLSRTDLEASCKKANPMFPASSPWMTAVGGTMLSKAASPACTYVSDDVIVTCASEGEVTCEANKGGGITTGGGFSNHFPRPWYQEEAVTGYLKQQDSPLPDPNGSWAYNPAGRAYPDVSGAASNYLVWMGTQFQHMSGTSASTPLVAAMVAHMNEQRLRRGEPPLGFLNPLLYRLGQMHPEGYKDVTMGDNHCGVTGRGDCCANGFGAARGWDAVTGFGSPHLGTLLTLLRPGTESASTIFLSEEPQAQVAADNSSPFALAAAGFAVGATMFGAAGLGALHRARKLSFGQVRGALREGLLGA